MAITVNAIEVHAIPSAGNDWNLSLYSADASGCETMKAAVADQHHFLKRLMIYTATEMTITIGSGEVDSAVETIHIGPVPVDSAGGVFVISFGRGNGLKCVEGKALSIDTSASGPIWIYAEGRTARMKP